MRSCALVVFALLAAASVAASEPTIHGHIVDDQGLSLPGVTVTLSATAGSVVATRTTDEDGVFAFEAPPGRYSLHAELTGFQALDRGVTAGDQAITLTMHLGNYHEQVNVAAEAAPVVGDAEPNAPVAVTRAVLDNGMLPNSQYDDVLPLLPNVVRGPDGQISVGGARAPEGALVVNGINATEPVAGGPGLLLPIEAVDSIDVFSGGYPANLGLATGGITAVHTRSGA